ncbi:fasciclin domain-containing protein [Nocardioides sp. MAH-18]|uniref:Fasciclin domain-containing protein n=1 Tax=Nocardioides agri TaxID=2682843 RepID=A0A6L6XR09_9ACTN|nr:MULTISPECIES: fasciclin domain-containing protein [unclassified Nocardioides]MBA2954895.1 fasciclin domain-containing protein [Nocardioides sp. CGMCC 1.13656]MVQ49749.1 fasciclin domain-containing protein [Nocardioides sp. MAH-18]
MNRSLRRTTGLAALALTATLGLAACSDDGDSNDTAADDSSMSSDMSTTPSDDMSSSDDMGSSDIAAQTFGSGCSAIPADGAGSLDGMATEPVATAASANPLLTTLVTAVGEAELVDTLNSADGITVFAPTDDAFGAVPKKDLNALLADKDALTKVLTYHVVPGQLTPDQLAGTHKTLEGEDLVVEGSGEEFTVGANKAAVICGNVPTANATVYVIDGVLMP